MIFKVLKCDWLLLLPYRVVEMKVASYLGSIIDSDLVYFMLLGKIIELISNICLYFIDYLKVLLRNRNQLFLLRFYLIFIVDEVAFHIFADNFFKIFKKNWSIHLILHLRNKFFEFAVVIVSIRTFFTSIIFEESIMKVDFF